MVLSAIFAQSLMIVNLPCEGVRLSSRVSRTDERPHDYAIFTNLDVIAYRCSLYDAASTYVDMIAYLHGVIVEVPAISLIGRSG